jgi:hypothetical protein
MNDYPDFLYFSLVDNAAAIAGELFARKFGHPLPDWPYDLMAFFRCGDGSLIPLSYTKFMPLGNVILVGGCMTDGRAFASMSEVQRARLTASGGAMKHLLLFGFERLADRCDAYFGYCGDARAWEVDLSAGFVPSGHDKLLVHWHKPLNEQTRRALVAMAHALGPF